MSNTPSTSSNPTKTRKVGCSIKMLPQEQWVVAANHAILMNRTNAPALGQLTGGTGVVLSAQHAALVTTKYWGSGGVHLTVGFLDTNDSGLKAKILLNMNAWNQFGNVTFVESAVDPQVRIARNAGDGYWSYLGTDINLVDKSQQTMNLDSFTLDTPDSEYLRVVRHETGHTLGFPHEHLRTEIVANIDPTKAIAYFLTNDGWTADVTTAQVLTPLDPTTLQVLGEPDQNSIMCYQLPGEIMKDGVDVIGGVDIDATDQTFVGQIYRKAASA